MPRPSASPARLSPIDVPGGVISLMRGSASTEKPPAPSQMSVCTPIGRTIAGVPRMARIPSSTAVGSLGWYAALRSARGTVRIRWIAMPRMSEAERK